MGHVIDMGTQKIVRELLDYAEALEKKTAIRPVKQPIILLGPKDIEEGTKGAGKGKKKKKITAATNESAGDPPKPTQPVILLGPKEITESAANGATARSGDPKPPPSPTQPIILLGPKSGKPVKSKKG